MSRRVLATLATLAAIVAVEGGRTSVLGQAPASAASSKTRAGGAWIPPAGPGGHPDLQGTWLNNSATPLERPKALEGRSTLTDEEVADLRRRADRLFNGTNADFAGGDAVFLSALADIDHFKSPNSTGTTFEMIEREFDNRTSLIIDPPDGRIPPLTADAVQKRAAADASRRRPAEGPEDLTLVERCLTYGVPRLSGTNTGAGPLGYYQIVQTPSYVVLFLEAIHEARVITLDGRPHLPASVRVWEGDSRGRWEGETLVVDTTNFTANNNFMGSSDRLHVVERFSRVGPDRVDYQITIDDPTTWTKPWTAVIRLKRSPEKLFEYACHEGNVEIIRDMLAAARVVEKK